MPPFDKEMVQPVQELLKAKGVELCLGDGLAGFAAVEVSTMATIPGSWVCSSRSEHDGSNPWQLGWQQ
jgi:hypothetical protein